mmetsp:Transcript_35355/g.82630  ORF Transcript_35355/g.82630 Transcript_35355/m.82630 type:complete len:807 (+) Transcript_35355:85-2505(+)
MMRASCNAFSLFLFFFSFGAAWVRAEAEVDESQTCDESAACPASSAAALLQVSNAMVRVHDFEQEELQLAGTATVFQESITDQRMILEVDGFEKSELNDIYATGPVLVNGKPTYVSEHSYAIYWCSAYGYWAINWFTTPLDPGSSTIAGCYAWAVWLHANPAEMAPSGQATLEWKGYWYNLRSVNAGVMSVQMTCSSYHSAGSCNGAPEGCAWKGDTCAARYHVFGPGGPQFDDIDQGALGTCYFLAAMASVAYFQPWALEQMYLGYEPESESSFPVHVVQFLLHGKPTAVAVDEYFPVTAENWPSFVQFNTKKLIVWPMIYEKAWAKVFGSFKGVEAGFGHEGFKAIAQAPMEFISHSGHASDASVLASIWHGLLEAVNSSFPMYAGTTSQAPSLGLAQGHAYAVLGAETMMVNGEEKRTVMLYNPWGTSNYNGACPNNATKVADGLFSMFLEEYAVAFSTTEVALVKPGYSVSYKVLTTGSSSLAVSVDFTVTVNKSFDIQLEWPSRRLSQRGGCDMPAPRVNLDVFKDGVNIVNASQTQQRKYEVLASVRASVPAGPGSYSVHVYVDFPNATWVDELVLNTYANESIELGEPVNLTDQPTGFVDLAGFQKSQLNDRFVERSGPHWQVGGRETYWSSNGFFIYYCAEYNDWRISAGNFDLPKQGLCYAWAFAPYGVDVLQVDKPKGWGEWSGSEWVFPVQGSGVVACTHASADYNPAASLLQGGSGTTEGSGVERCRDVLDRLDHLNNAEEIAANGTDTLFPPVLSSIAKQGESCGDTAQGIAESCEGFNHWALLSEIMGDARR